MSFTLYENLTANKSEYDKECVNTIISNFKKDNPKSIEALRGKSPYTKLCVAENLDINLLSHFVNKQIGSCKMEPVIFFQHAINRMVDNYLINLKNEMFGKDNLYDLNSEAYNLFSAYIYSHGFVQCYSSKQNEYPVRKSDTGLSFMFDLYAHLKKKILDEFIFKNSNISGCVITMVDIDCNSSRFVLNDEYITTDETFITTIENLLKQKPKSRINNFSVIPLHYKFKNTSAHFMCLLADSQYFTLVDVNPSWVDQYYIMDKKPISTLFSKITCKTFKGNLFKEINKEVAYNFHNNFFNSKITFGVCEILTRVIVKDIVINNSSITAYMDEMRSQMKNNNNEWILKYSKSMHSEYKQLFTDSYSNYFSDKMQYYITAIVPNSINCLHHYSSFYFPCFIEYSTNHYHMHEKIYKFLSKEDTTLPTFLKNVYMKVLYPYYHVLKIDKKIIVLNRKQRHDLFCLHHYIITSSCVEEETLQTTDLGLGKNCKLIVKLLMYSSEYEKLENTKFNTIYYKWYKVMKYILHEMNIKNDNYKQCLNLIFNIMNTINNSKSILKLW